MITFLLSNYIAMRLRDLFFPLIRLLLLRFPILPRFIDDSDSNLAVLLSNLKIIESDQFNVEVRSVQCNAICFSMTITQCTGMKTKLRNQLSSEFNYCFTDKICFATFPECNLLLRKIIVLLFAKFQGVILPIIKNEFCV